MSDMIGKIHVSFHPKKVFQFINKLMLLSERKQLVK